MKSIAKFHAMTDEQLGALSTRLLLEVLKGTRSIGVCDCGSVGCDGGLEAHQHAFNAAQFELQEKTQALLATREHVEPRPAPAPRIEKKKSRMAY